MPSLRFELKPRNRQVVLKSLANFRLTREYIRSSLRKHKLYKIKRAPPCQHVIVTSDYPVQSGCVFSVNEYLLSIDTDDYDDTDDDN
jgi:hypothetical protein